MKVYILGKNNDDKGNQLESLTCQILENQGFHQISTNIQVSGGSELDVRAEKYTETGIKKITIPVLCECKAHNRPINMEDWLKFIGKLYIERKKGGSSSNTIGLMISLFGANGNVRGSYKDDFHDDERIQLIANDDLFKILASLYNISDPTTIKENLLKDYKIHCWDVDIIYYNKKCYTLISLDESRFSICNTTGELLKYNEISELLLLLNNWTPYSTTGYVDLWEKIEASKLLSLIESSIITGIFQMGEMTIEKAQNHIIYSDDKSPVSTYKIKEAAKQSAFINYSEEKNLMSVNIGNNIIEFIIHIFDIGLSP